MKNLVTQIVRPTLLILAATFMVVAGCNDDNGTNNLSGEGQVVLVMHDAPVDDFTEVWLTVESVTMISDDDSNDTEVLLSDAVRMDFLALDSISQVLAMGNVRSGIYSKIRLQVSNPEFVRDDDSVFTEPDVKLVANGHVDLNPQGSIMIDANQLNVISLDLDLDNSIQINETGNGRFILRPQIFIEGDDEIDEDGDDDAEITIDNATIVSIDLLTGVLVVSVPGSPDNLTVTTNAQTEIEGSLAALIVGSEIEIEGDLDIITGDIIATEIELED